jgi:spore coat protein U-like protein
VVLGACACPATGAADTLLATTKSVTVTAQIVTGCGVTNGSGGALNFGTVDFGSHSAVAAGAVSAALVGNSSVQIQCSPGTSVTMSVDGGLSANGGGGQRNLRGPGSVLLAYQLFRDAGHTQTLGVAQAVSIPASGTFSLPIYASLSLPGRGIPAGTYTDTLQVTLTY